MVCSKVMKVTAEGHLASLPDLPLNSCRGSYSPNPNRGQRAREPPDGVHTDQWVWVGWVRVKEAQGKCRELMPLSCQPRNSARAMICPTSFPSQAWALSACGFSSSRGNSQGAGPALLEVAHGGRPSKDGQRQRRLQLGGSLLLILRRKAFLSPFSPFPSRVPFWHFPY